MPASLLVKSMPTGGENFDNALRAYQQANGLESTGSLNEQTWNAFANSSTDRRFETIQLLPATWRDLSPSE